MGCIVQRLAHATTPCTQMFCPSHPIACACAGVYRTHTFNTCAHARYAHAQSRTRRTQDAHACYAHAQSRTRRKYCHVGAQDVWLY